MQKLSACRKRCSSTHFFSSTSMRCMSAICPAGPPKPRQPIFSQTRNASRERPAYGPRIPGMRLVLARCTTRRARRRSPCRARASRGRPRSCATGPSEMASRPGACGARSRRAVSAPRTMSASSSQRRVVAGGILEEGVEAAALAVVRELDVRRCRRASPSSPSPTVQHLRRPARRGTRRPDRRSGASATGRRCGRSSAARA